MHFFNDQVGILSGGQGGTVSVVDSRFTRGGVGGDQPKYALMIGPSDRLLVRGCTFADVKGGQISTAAARSEIVGSTIGVGTGDAEEDPAYAVLATEGALLMDDDVVTAGPLPPRSGAAIGVWDRASATIHKVRFVNQTGRSLALVKDWSWREVVLLDNTLGSGDSAVTSSGLWRHRASSQYHERKEQARALASRVKQMIKHALGR